MERYPRHLAPDGQPQRSRKAAARILIGWIVAIGNDSKTVPITINAKSQDKIAGDDSCSPLFGGGCGTWLLDFDLSTIFGFRTDFTKTAYLHGTFLRE